MIEPVSWEDATFPGSTFTKEHRASVIRRWSKGPLAIENDLMRQARYQQQEAEKRRKYEAASEREGFERWSDAEVEKGLEPAPAAPSQPTGRRDRCQKSQQSRRGPQLAGSLGLSSESLIKLPLPRAEDWQKKHNKQIEFEKKKSYGDNTKGCATPACP